MDEQGAFVVYLKDLEQSSSARQALIDEQDRWLPANQDPYSVELKFIQGQYAWTELYGWYKRLRSIYDDGALVFVDIDERQNRLHIGVETTAAIGDMETKIANLSIPLSAVVLQQASRDRPLATTLDDLVRPIQGGFRIVSDYWSCTLGVNTRSTSFGWGFLTVSHCTSPDALPDGEMNSVSFGQNVHSRSVGVEIIDPPFITGSACYSGKKCRWSDAAMVKYDSASQSDMGMIARTFENSIELDNSQPDWQIQNEHGDATIAGSTVLDKVGQATGWTKGVIDKTCDDRFLDNDIVLLCQAIVTDTYITSGDSGAAVFERTGGANNVTLYGIAWGQAGGDPTKLLFSHISNIQLELGSFVTECGPDCGEFE